jgi:multimeric flavodoxin WrbA
MRRLLFVHHTPSPAMQAMFEAVLAGARTDEIEGVEVVVAPALTAGAADVLNADGYLLGTPANIGYMSIADAERKALICCFAGQGHKW